MIALIAPVLCGAFLCQSFVLAPRGLPEKPGPVFLVRFDPSPLEAHRLFPRGWSLQAAGRKNLLFQYDPPARGEGKGILAVALPGGPASLAFVPKQPSAAEPLTSLGLKPLQVRETKEGFWVESGAASVFYDKRAGGLPRLVRFPDGRTFSFHLNDRLYGRGRGGYLLRDDAQARLSVPARGPLRVVVRAEARYGGSRKAPGSPCAVYLFEHMAGSPFVRVSVQVRQKKPVAWSELHVLEINLGRDFKGSWAAGEPYRSGSLAGAKRSYRGDSWGLLRSGAGMLGLSGTPVIIYDDNRSYGTYLHGPWVRFAQTQASFELLWYIGPSADRLPAEQRFLSYFLTTPELQERAEKLQQRSLLAKAVLDCLSGEAPFELYRKAVDSLYKTSGREIPRGLSLQGRQAGSTVLLFSEKERSVLGLWEEGRRLLSDSGGLWLLELEESARGVKHEVKPSDRDLAFSLRSSEEGAFVAEWRSKTGLQVSLKLQLNPGDLSARFQIASLPPGASLSAVRFPVVRLGPFAGGGPETLLYPQVSGRLESEPYSRAFRMTGTYPSGWCPVQCLALYDEEGGLYAACEDPTASRKDFNLRGSPEGLEFYVLWPAPDCGRPGNTWRIPGRVRFRTFKGDWFDAALLYRGWAEREAPWLRPRKRPTPRWFEDIAVWALASGAPRKVASEVCDFSRFFDVPKAVHWYNWHRIPFDTDYPHYFPAKEGFRRGVADLHRCGVRVMPYINGRLWDTGLEDFKGKVRAAATKDRAGKVYIEQYGSGRKLAPMCPTTKLWQAKVAEIVSRLFGTENPVDAVYIDQVAAAKPRLCFDPSHGHPLGGGSWWIDQGYRVLLEKIRSDLPKDAVLTTECNAEPYIDLFDGYLTWHFQYQNQVPFFAAVYGGRIQLFGRAYRGGPTARAAMRMKTAQAFVFGEQLGWINPQVVKDPVNGPFLRRLARLRYKLRDFLARGRMARPPRILTEVPQVTADWRWHGAWPITVSVLQRGAWSDGNGNVALLFVNIDGEELPFCADCTGSLGKIGSAGLVCEKLSESGSSRLKGPLNPRRLQLRLKPYDAFALCFKLKRAE